MIEVREGRVLVRSWPPFRRLTVSDQPIQCRIHAQSTHQQQRLAKISPTYVFRVFMQSWFSEPDTSDH